MKRIYPLLFLTISILRADDLPSGGPAPLTLPGATAAALEHNPAIQEARSRWEAAKERVAQEGAWDDMQLSAMSRLARFVPMAGNTFTDQTLSFTQALPITGKNLVRARAAVAEALMAFEDSRRAELDVVAQTRAAYYQLANAQAQVELNRQNLALLNQISEVTRVRYQAGSQGAAEVLAAETEAGKLLESAKDLRRSITAAQSQINVLMGRDAFAPVGGLEQANPTWAAPPLDKLRELMFANRPEILSAEARLAAGKARLDLAHRSWIPDPSLVVQGQRYNSGQGVDEVDAGISISIPWTNARKYSAAEREAAANVAAAEHALEGARQAALGMLRTGLTDAETAMHHRDISGTTRQARDALKASEIGYEAGKVSLSDWIASATMVRDLESMRRQQETDLQVAIAQLEATVGAPLNTISK